MKKPIPIKTRQELKTYFGKDFKTIFNIYPILLDLGYEMEIPDRIQKYDQIIGKCNEYEVILLHCISYLEEGRSKAKLISIFMDMISKRFEIPKERPIKIRGDFQIVYEN